MGRKKKEVEIINDKGKTSMVLGRRDVLELVLDYTSPSLRGKGAKKMCMVDACKKAGITYETLRNWLMQDENLNNSWEMALMRQKEVIAIQAKKNIEDAIDGEVKLKPREKVEVSMKYLQLTSPEFQPKLQVEQKGINMMFNVSSDELQARMRDFYESNNTNQTIEDNE